MKTKSIKDVIDSRLSYMKIDPDVKEAILEKAISPISIKTHKRFKKPMIAAAAVMLCLILSVPILGAVSEDFNNILFGISPEFAELLMPLDKECISNGIKMEVVAAVADEENGAIYLTLQDVEEDRLQGYARFMDPKSDHWYIVFSPNEYDEESRTIYMQLVTAGYFDSNKPQTMTLKELEVGNSEVALDIDLTQVRESQGIVYEIGEKYENGYFWYITGTATNDINGMERYGYFSYLPDNAADDMLEAGSTRFLETDVYDSELPTRMQISNIGFIDGKLHIQTVQRRTSEWEFSSLYLSKSNMEDDILNPEYGFELLSLSDDNVFYKEEVFDISPEDLADYRIYIWENTILDGEWTASFRLDVHESKQIDCDVAVRDAKVGTLTISPIKMRIEYLGWGRDGEPFDVIITMKNGETIKYTIDLLGDEQIDASEGYELTYSSSVEINYKGYTVEIFPSIPFDVDNIAEITVNNVVIS